MKTSPLLKIEQREATITEMIKQVQALKAFESDTDPAKEAFLKILKARVDEIENIKRIIYESGNESSVKKRL